MACDQAMWQAPTLTIAGQSFLLALLANQDLATDVRRLVFIAGVLAVFAAVVALLRLRSREVLYSEAIAAYSERLGIPDPRPDQLERDRLKRRGPFAWVDERLRGFAGWWLWPPGYWLWIAALIAFGVADYVAFAA